MRLRATGQTLELVESERLVSGSVEIYTAAFEFDAAWDGYAKTAVFTDDMGRSAEIALTDNTCTVPWEILRAGKYIHIGIYGVNGDKRYPTIYQSWRKAPAFRHGDISHTLLPRKEILRGLH